MRLDSYDLQILKILQHNGRITKSQLAETINLSISPCWERVRKLELAGIIQGYGAKINADVLFKYTPVLVEVILKEHSALVFKRFESVILATPEVSECYATGGGVDYILTVQAQGINQYQQIIDHWLNSEIGIERYYTYVVTKTVKKQQANQLAFLSSQE